MRRSHLLAVVLGKNRLMRCRDGENRSPKADVR
jgi:hypothetical protein